MNTTIHTATILVAHRQAELRALADRPARRRPAAATASLTDSFSLAALLRRLVPTTRRPALV